MRLKEDCLVKDERYMCVSALLGTAREMLETQVRGELAGSIGFVRTWVEWIYPLRSLSGGMTDRRGDGQHCRHCADSHSCAAGKLRGAWRLISLDKEFRAPVEE